MNVFKIMIGFIIIIIFIFKIPSYIIPDEKIEPENKYDDRSIWFLHFFMK
ncbi:MAG: hypothetical protein PHE29_08700 [Tissierellia bacterium]|nr:hypothetical protein [Tissierellia bacterium]MDD4780780.1 hypothetical protein [Tissierellia bacterium]